MATITNALQAYLQAKSSVKWSREHAHCLQAFALLGDKELTYANLMEWVYRPHRQGVMPSLNRMNFVRSFLRFTNNLGISDIRLPLIPPSRKRTHTHPEQAALRRSPMSDLLECYISHMRSAHAMSDRTHQRLRLFNEYCATHFSADSTSYQDMVDGWCQVKDTERPDSFNNRIAPIRAFIRYINKKLTRPISLPIYLPRGKRTYLPHPFSDEEIRKLVDYTDSLSWSGNHSLFAFNVRKMVMPVWLRLLYSTGMRTCEVRLLSCDDVDLEHGVINVRRSKGIHEHRVAMHETMWTLMEQYDTSIRRLLPQREAFFPDEHGSFLRCTWGHYHFNLAWKTVSNEPARVYDLRSNYAVANINRWKNIGAGWLDKFLYLSRSMGHRSINSTAYYYNLVPVFAEQLERLSGSNLGEILPDLTDLCNEEQ